MYGLKYSIPFKTLSNVDCVVNVELKDYIGSSMELIGGGDENVKMESSTYNLIEI